MQKVGEMRKGNAKKRRKLSEMTTNWPTGESPLYEEILISISVFSFSALILFFGFLF